MGALAPIIFPQRATITRAISKNLCDPANPCTMEYLEELIRRLLRGHPKPPFLFGRSDESGPLGLFGRLPTEINFMIFSYMPLGDVGNIALTSKSAKALAASYLSSKACLRRVLVLAAKMSEVIAACWY